MSALRRSTAQRGALMPYPVSHPRFSQDGLNPIPNLQHARIPQPAYRIRHRLAFEHPARHRNPQRRIAEIQDSHSPLHTPEPTCGGEHKVPS